MHYSIHTRPSPLIPPSKYRGPYLIYTKGFLVYHTLGCLQYSPMVLGVNRINHKGFLWDTLGVSWGVTFGIPFALPWST